MNSQDISVPMSGTQGEPPNPFVELVFSIPLLLAKILSACASDLKTLLNLRLVNKTWKDEVYSTFLNNLSILPTIDACSPLYFYSDPDEVLLFKTPESFCEKFPLGSGFSGIPLKLKLGYSFGPEPAVINFLQRHADKVVVLKYFHDFERENDSPNEDYFQFEFPMLKHAKLICKCLSTEASTNLAKLLLLYNQVLESSHNLKTLKVGVDFTLINPLPFDHPSLDLLPFAKITSVESSAAFLDKLATTHALPKLKEVHMCRDAGTPIGSVVRSQLLMEIGENLTNIVILPDTNAEIGYLKELRTLTIWIDSSVRCGLQNDTPIAQLLPNLTKLHIGSSMGASRVLSEFTNSEVGFDKLTQLILDENSATSFSDPTPDFDRVTTCFNKLKSLQWKSGRCIREVIPAAQYMFSNLQHLTELLLWFNMDLDPFLFFQQTKVDPLREIFMLLTGMYPDEIPEDPVMWKTTLEGRPTAICNLKNLKTFQIRTKWISNKRGVFPSSNTRPVFPERESRFLFHAAFNQMDSLKVIKINTVSFDDNCIAQWMASGRKFVGDMYPQF